MKQERKGNKQRREAKKTENKDVSKQERKVGKERQDRKHKRRKEMHTGNKAEKGNNIKNKRRGTQITINKVGKK